jgi:hypothetical protein
MFNVFAINNNKFQYDCEALKREFKPFNIPSSFFFTHYLSKVTNEECDCKSYLLKKASEFLSGYIESVQPPQFFAHLCNIYEYFHLDEEVNFVRIFFY